ncbi:hypothetical protein [Streptomyces sp. NPDC002209]
MPATDGVDAYLAGVPEARREALTRLRGLLRATASAAPGPVCT